MKIIISESQYNLLLESNYEKNKKLVGNMWDEGMSFSEIQDLIGLNKSQLYFLLKDKEQNIDCSEANQIITGMISNTDLINKKIDLTNFDYEGGSLELSYDRMVGTLNFIYKNNVYHIEGMATPYWNGECSIPVDIGYFEDLATNEYNDEYDEMQMTVDYGLVPKKFNSYQEIIDFMNNEYPNLIIPKIKNSIPHYIDRLSK